MKYNVNFGDQISNHQLLISNKGKAHVIQHSKSFRPEWLYIFKSMKWTFIVVNSKANLSKFRDLKIN